MANWFRAAWIARLWDEHSAALELYASQWTDSPEDCVQEVIVKLTRLAEPPRQPAAWLFHAVRLQAISAHRSASRRRQHEGSAARLVRIESSTVDASFDAEELMKALDQLSGEEREVVVARTWGNLGFAEIAEMTGLSVSTVFRRYESGLKSLRNNLESSCSTKPPPSTMAKQQFPRS